MQLERTLRSYAIAVGACTALLMVPMLATAQSTAQDVTVVNPASAPANVKSVAGSTVGIEASRNVVKAAQNAPTVPYVVTELQREPFAVTMASQTSGVSTCVPIPVPSGRRVVVTALSGFGSAPAELRVDVPGIGINSVLVSAGYQLVQGTPTTQPRYALSEQLELRIPRTATAPEGTRTLGAPKACLRLFGGLFVDATVSGYYEKLH